MSGIRLSGVAATAGTTAGLLWSRLSQLIEHGPPDRAEDIAAAVVMTAGICYASWYAVGAVAAVMALCVRRAGRRAARIETALRRWAPPLVRRALGTGTHLALGLSLMAAPAAVATPAPWSTAVPTATDHVTSQETSADALADIPIDLRPGTGSRPSPTDRIAADTSATAPATPLTHSPGEPLPAGPDSSEPTTGGSAPGGPAPDDRSPHDAVPGESRTESPSAPPAADRTATGTPAQPTSPPYRLDAPADRHTTEDDADPATGHEPERGREHRHQHDDTRHDDTGRDDTRHDEARQDDAGTSVASTSDPATPDTTPPDTTAPGPTEPDSAMPLTYTVRPGDSLWQIASSHMAGHPSDAAVAAAWPLWYEANTDVIGPDPDLIHPGLELRIPHQLDRSHPSTDDLATEEAQP